MKQFRRAAGLSRGSDYSCMAGLDSTAVPRLEYLSKFKLGGIGRISICDASRAEHADGWQLHTSASHCTSTLLVHSLEDTLRSKEVR